MEWIDWVILGAVGALVVGIVAYLIKQKKKGKGGYIYEIQGLFFFRDYC